LTKDLASTTTNAQEIRDVLIPKKDQDVFAQILSEVLIAANLNALLILTVERTLSA
jgi:hypothetical protein